jgi:hypothetical protein
MCKISIALIVYNTATSVSRSLQVIESFNKHDHRRFILPPSMHQSCARNLLVRLRKNTQVKVILKNTRNMCNKNKIFMCNNQTHFLCLF